MDGLGRALAKRRGDTSAAGLGGASGQGAAPGGELAEPGQSACRACVWTSVEGLCLEPGSDCLVESSSPVFPFCGGLVTSGWPGDTRARCPSWSQVPHSPSSLVPGRGMVHPPVLEAGGPSGAPPGSGLTGLPWRGGCEGQATETFLQALMRLAFWRRSLMEARMELVKLLCRY